MSKSFSFLVVLIFYVSAANAQVPATLSYQGLLTDAAGVPVADGNYDVSFRFYVNATDVEADAALVRGPIQVTTFKGLFTTIIGNSQPSAIVNAPLPVSIGQQQHWVGIKIGTQTEMTPRVMLTAVPYAFVATTVKSVDASVIISGTIADDRLSDHLRDLADGILSGNKVGSGLNASNITTGTLSAANISLSGTDASKLASGTTGQRPGSPVEGQVRYNSTEKVMEYFNGTDWYFISPKVTFLKDKKTAGTGGGTFPANAWVARVLNRREGDNSFAVLVNNTDINTQFTLTAGTYVIEGSAQGYSVGNHKCKLVKTSGTPTDVVTGTTESTEVGTSKTASRSFLYGSITITATETFQMQHRSFDGNSGNGLGAGSGDTATWGTEETYAVLKITKLR